MPATDLCHVAKKNETGMFKEKKNRRTATSLPKIKILTISQKKISQISASQKTSISTKKSS